MLRLRDFCSTFRNVWLENADSTWSVVTRHQANQTTRRCQAGEKLTAAFVCCRWGHLTRTAMTHVWPSRRPGCAHWARRWWWLARQARCWWCRWSARCARRNCRPSPSTSSATGTTLCGRATRPWHPPSGTCASPPATSPPASCSSTPLLPALPLPSTPSGSCESGLPPALIVRVPAG